MTAFVAGHKQRAMHLLANGGLILLLIAIVIAVSAYIQPRFLSQQNIINVLRNASILSIISMGQMLVMIAGGFDLSVGVIVAFASIESALLMGYLIAWMPEMQVLAVVLAVALAIGTGAAIGLANGMLVALVGLSPFMVTLAMSSVVAGATFYVTKGIPIYGMPDFFMTAVGRGFLFGLPVVVVVGIVVVLLTVAVQRLSSFGRHVYAVGSNPIASRQSGVSVTRILLSVYAASGAAAALTGILLTARIGSGQSTFGGTYVLESIAAAVVGGVSLIGGSGRAERVMAGALFLSVVSNSMNLLKIDSKYQTLVLGVVLIAALCSELLLKGRRKYD
ncbi:ribose transport system permease protein [Mesorhizobium robiniae]|uniref:Ribose transport system permease protein n=1 Tax=Mesorhizobium robiniae TaxID=559315 RepID=A0ABV2GIN5_9HYPH